MIRRVITAGAIGVATVGLLAAPAAAHVTIDPPSVPKGGSAQISFIVPNESATARTNKVQLFFPGAPDAIPDVAVEALDGWHFTIRKQKLTEPIKTDDGSFDEAVGTITWIANNASTAIGTDEYAAFSISIDGIPEDADELVFRVVQTYTDGTAVRWVDPVSDTGPEADHPTPILKLTDGTGSGTATPTTAASSQEPGSSSSGTTVSTQDDNARALAVIAIVVGGVALVAATGALMRRRRAK